jgi:hypothetical protein
MRDDLLRCHDCLLRLLQPLLQVLYHFILLLRRWSLRRHGLKLFFQGFKVGIIFKFLFAHGILQCSGAIFWTILLLLSLTSWVCFLFFFRRICILGILIGISLGRLGFWILHFLSWFRWICLRLFSTYSVFGWRLFHISRRRVFSRCLVLSRLVSILSWLLLCRCWLYIWLRGRIRSLCLILCWRFLTHFYL